MSHPIARMAGVAAVLLAAAGPVAAQSPAGTRWVVDPVHSQVEFGIRHLLGRVRGSFTRWYALIATQDRDWTRGTVDVQVQTASINTGNAYRDADLRSPRFLNTDSFPKMTFKSTGIVARDSTVELHGILTLKGHVRHVVLKGNFRGIGKDREGKDRYTPEVSVDQILLLGSPGGSTGGGSYGRSESSGSEEYGEAAGHDDPAADDIPF